jgi:hypothetical protein
MNHVHKQGNSRKEVNKQAAYRWWQEPTPLGAASASLRLFSWLVALFRNVPAKRHGHVSRKRLDT